MRVLCIHNQTDGYVHKYIHIRQPSEVATISRLPTNIGLFCERAL